MSTARQRATPVRQHPGPAVQNDNDRRRWQQNDDDRRRWHRPGA
ncbi:hypothetical protein OG792_26550 [Micromonospora sp. NBC_01699]|nr:hypothetical protein [Micromonospora sp. NBC_01699]